MNEVNNMSEALQDEFEKMSNLIAHRTEQRNRAEHELNECREKNLWLCNENLKL